MMEWTIMISRLASASAKKADPLFPCGCKSVSKDFTGLRRVRENFVGSRVMIVVWVLGVSGSPLREPPLPGGSAHFAANSRQVPCLPPILHPWLMLLNSYVNPLRGSALFSQS